MIDHRRLVIYAQTTNLAGGLMPKKSKWWETDPKERFWLEVTNRPNIGDDLQAPLVDRSGHPHPFDVLFQDCSLGDIVFHYDKNRRSVVGYSEVVGGWDNDDEDYFVPIGNFHKLDHQISLSDIRSKQKELAILLSKLHSAHKNKPLYYPFERGEKRPIRPLQGYSFKLPYGFLELFPDAISEIEKLPLTPSIKTKPPDIEDALNDDPDEWQNFARRIRRGQGIFRANLLKAYGERCALTGHGPASVLEAVHIISHAETGINELDNGLLLRADLHNLFDDGKLKIDPDDFTIVVDDSLMGTPYWELHGKKLRTRKSKKPLSSKFLRERW
ncbi:MAG: HNH endonuclease [Desulfarculus sp.]|nr:HNH endonuclease [Desulfarculus sp.]MBV1751617.1 HNH endonuclease [Desulfarculus sp.]